MAPGEGLEPPTGWLIPNAFGTLPTEQIFYVCLALLCFDLLFPMHGLRTCFKTFRIITYPWTPIPFGMLAAMVISIVMLRESPVKIIGMTYVITPIVLASENVTCIWQDLLI